MAVITEGAGVVSQDEGLRKPGDEGAAMAASGESSRWPET
jgi:hypothetical protein